MAMTNAQKQAAWRARRNALARSAEGLQKRIAELEAELARERAEKCDALKRTMAS